MFGFPFFGKNSRKAVIISFACSSSDSGPAYDILDLADVFVAKSHGVSRQ
jgi:hypothetical protein